MANFKKHLEVGAVVGTLGGFFHSSIQVAKVK